MQNDNFYAQVRALLNNLFLTTGNQLDLSLTGYSIDDAVHLNIDPAMAAIVRTEHRIAPRMLVDLRELVKVAPPIEEEMGGGENLFITFTAESAQFEGGNATAFGIHCTRLESSAAEIEELDGGIFVPGFAVTDAFRLVVFLRAPSGDVSLARTGVVLGLNENGRLIAYQSFQFNPGLSTTSHAPSSLAEADSNVMLYIFLTLSVFMTVHQGETTLRWENENAAVIG
jgi:hypothetical protein